MKAKDFIAVVFPQEQNKTYYAEITNVNGSSFECRFVHSGSKYKFQNFGGWLEVKSTNGGFPGGTRINKTTLFQERQTQPVAAGSNAVITFQDTRSYIGEVQSAGSNTIVRFLHSNNIYSIGSDGIAHSSSGGVYNGQRVLQMKSFDSGTSLFSPQQEATLSLMIEDAFGKPVCGEFDVKIKRADSGASIYSNVLTAEEASGHDRNISLPVSEGQQLILAVDFHPALEPYTSNPISSSVIDRDTSVSGTSVFSFKKLSQLLFKVKIVSDSTTVTATSSSEAIHTVHKEVSTGHTTGTSFSREAKLGGEASIKLIGAKILEVGIGANGEGTLTMGSDSEESVTTTNGTEDGQGTAESTSKTYNVYYPMGLKIEPAFSN